MSRRAPFAIEWRRRSRRTKSGWTQWTHYIVAETREDAERICESDWMKWWMHDEKGELRVVERNRDRDRDERDPAKESE